MTDPHDPLLPRSTSDLDGPPDTGARMDPASFEAGSGSAGSIDREPVASAAGRGTPAPGFDQKGHVRRTRAGGAWIGSILTALFVILLIIFIAQNSRRVAIHFFGWHGQFSLALTILLAAVLGMLLVAIPGSLRILQLRRALRKNVPSGRTS